MTRFRILSFDAEGTLITHGFSEIVWNEAIPKLYSEKAGINLDEAKSYIYSEYAKVGEERVEWYDIHYWFDRFGLTDYEELLMAHKDEITYYPEVHHVLEELSKNYKLIVNSNSAREFLELEMERINVFLHRVFSAPSDFNQIKKSGEVYLKICDCLEVEPTEIVHVGDHWFHDFVIPREIGVLSFYLDRKEDRFGEFIIKTLEEFKEKVEKIENCAC